MEELSPAEKYDLLIGDENYTFTKHVLNEGRNYYETTGKVEPWMGICHGWAPSSYMLGRPKHTVEVLAWDGKTKIKFYPTDIKALASFLWASSSSKARFIGGRCNKKDPKTDENGRVLEQDCFDTNPGSWHISVVNQIGVSKRSFVIDATYDYEVWNQPVYSYEYSYFNPKTLKPVKTISEATILKKDFKNDKFKAYRSENATSMVGISMKLVYIAETRANLSDLDFESKDRKVSVHYLYDLELDRKGNIIGGEWYHNHHPDFMWTPEPSAKPVTAGDLYLRKIGDRSNWSYDSKHPIPDNWRDAALRSSSSGEVVGQIVDSLISKSRDLNEIPMSTESGCKFCCVQ
jgi:hypothetical protein